VGILETIDALNCSDEEKARMRREYAEEVDPLKTERDNLKANDRAGRVRVEIANLSDAGLKEAPKALAFLRRLYLSPDAEEPGVVLFADHELGLSGDESTGARSREEMSTKQAFEHFFSLLPQDKDGKLKIALSDQGVLTEDHGKPKTGDDVADADANTAAHKSSLGRAIGREIGRPSREKRYGGRTSSGGGE
jgi:hypothetical protein